MKTCRGCAGTGIGQHVSPRIIAIIESFGYTWMLVPVDARRKIRIIHVGPAGPAAANWVRAPLAEALAKLERLLDDGFTYEPTTLLPLDPAWKCSWCHGTGTPQLSVGTMQAVVV